MSDHSVDAGGGNVHSFVTFFNDGSPKARKSPTAIAITNHQGHLLEILFPGLGLQTCCLATFLAMFLPGRKRKLLGREGYFREAEQVQIELEKD